MAFRQVPFQRLTGHLSPTDGLREPEAAQRLRQYGPNEIVESPPHPWWSLVSDTAKDPMLWFFGATSGVYALVGQRTEALTLLVAIAPLVVMDLYLHRRTRASTTGLSSRLATRASVIRDGAERDVPVTDLVPGDLVVLKPNDPVPADGVLAAATGMQADESVLTGEAFPVTKSPLAAAPLDDREHPIDEAHWVFAGTRVLTGECRFWVVHTGAETLYGEIVRSAVQSSHESTPLQAAIRHLVLILLGVAVAMCVVLAAIRLYQGHGWLDAAISAVTLATAAMPEEFPVVFSFFLGVGVYRLAKRQALVRRAVTVENIGRVTCICSDKTGTITEGRLRLAHMLPRQGVSESEVLAVAAFASRSESGDPMDEAIIESAQQAGVPQSHTRLALFPFTEDRKKETAISRAPDGKVYSATKGAAEVVLSQSVLDSDERAAWLSRIEALAADAHKVIAVASCAIDGVLEPMAEPASGLRFLGLLAFEDPVRDGVPEAVEACRAAGIRTIMVTGDHPATATAVAREIGLFDGGVRLLTGEQMEIAASEGGDLLSVDVVARAKPAQKLLLVRTLQKHGQIVAVTGDGVNDVPALQAADIGVAMGERGTRSAREVASIVLLDDNFRTIVGAVAEGRQLFRNLQKSFHYLLVVHIPLVLTAAIIPLAGFPLLYLPVHIVWLEMILHPTAMLVFQGLPARGNMPPALPRGRARFFDAVDWTSIGSSSLLLTLFVGFGYLRSVQGGNVEHGRAMAIAVLTLGSAAVTAQLSGLRTVAARTMFVITVGLSVLLIQTPRLDRLVHLQGLHWDDWALAAVAAAAVGLVPAVVARIAGRLSRRA
ncbi:MAG: cation-transporting P-type ATPase [Phycisphaerales bacterium]|nr:cation-transporting P-type ATPase [Phycisphaerales bacterium]